MDFIDKCLGEGEKITVLALGEKVSRAHKYSSLHSVNIPFAAFSSFPSLFTSTVGYLITQC